MFFYHFLARKGKIHIRKNQPFHEAGVWEQNKIMFGIFKKKSKAEVLMEKYKKLQEEAFRLSTVNRAAADEKLKEAEEILKEIESLSQ